MEGRKEEGKEGKEDREKEGKEGGRDSGGKKGGRWIKEGLDFDLFQY